ncbi:MAG TPA: methyltransferase domain-containing protein [Egibacteraceae bacterium]|nr:methyltransferase domain-containing protein [Egibacteraceae bacterium]
MPEEARTGRVAPLARAAEAAGVRDARVLAALQAVSRAGFVPLEHRPRADLDEPIPVPGEQTANRPSLTARMLEVLELDAHHRVLEIGSGFGFQTALLGLLTNEVWSIERRIDVARAARANLSAHRIRNVHVVVADGAEGWREAAPFDAIIVSTEFGEVPPALLAQLAREGRLVQPSGGADASVAVFTSAKASTEDAGD